MLNSAPCISIAIIDDDIVEGPHGFNFTIMGIVPSGSSLMISDAVAVVNIGDNDGKPIVLVNDSNIG